MRTFVVATGTLKASQQNAISQFFQSGGWGFWHFLPLFWIVQTNDSSMTTQKLRNDLLPLLEPPKMRSLGHYGGLVSLPQIKGRAHAIPFRYGDAGPLPREEVLPADVFVMEIDPLSDWAGRGTEGMFNWLQHNLK